jgi:hypothetical protein
MRPDRRHTPAARLFQAFLFLLAAFPAQAQPVSGTYRVAGTVVNAVTGEPVARAAVALLAHGDGETVGAVETDADGRFAVDRLPAAKFQLTASKRGYRTSFYLEHEDFSTAIVTGPGQDTTHLVFRLAPNAVLRGVVTAEGGDPVEGARVQLFLLPPEHGSGRSSGHGPSGRIAQADSATTDDTGSYEFGNLAAGKYMLAVMAEPWYALHPSGNRTGRKAEGAALDVAYSTTFFDSTTDEAAATPIVLVPGSREEANIILHAVPAVHLVVDAPARQDGSIARPELTQTLFGLQMPGPVSLPSADPSHAATAEFSGVAPGHYELQHGDPARIAEIDASTSQRIDPGEGAAAVSVSGTLRTGSGAVIPDEATVALYATDGSHRPDQFATAAHQGVFRFDSVVAGNWELWAWSAGRPLPVVAVSSGGANRKGNVVTVRDRPLTIAASVARGQSEVEGFARRDGKGFAGAMVMLAPKNLAAYEALIRRDQSDSDGSFSLHDVAPGQYTVVAIQDGWPLDWTNPETMARYLAGGVAVTVTESSGKSLNLPDAVPVQAR